MIDRNVVVDYAAAGRAVREYLAAGRFNLTPDLADPHKIIGLIFGLLDVIKALADVGHLSDQDLCAIIEVLQCNQMMIGED